MDKVEKRNRIQVYLTDEIKKYVFDQSKNYGMSVSAYINMCIVRNKEQSEALEKMSQLENMVTELKTIQLANSFNNK